MSRFLITGASRGLGELLHLKLPQKLDTVYLVSRSEPQQPRDGVKRYWIQADLSQQGAAKLIAEAVGEATLDVLIYNAGIWEENAFSEKYDFESVNEEEIGRIMNVNLTSAIMVVQKLLPNLRTSSNPKIILIGSVSAKAYSRGREVACVASKAGLLGVASSLRENLRNDKIAVTCINPGNFGALREGIDVLDAKGIPADDLLETMRYVLRLSNASCIREIDLVAMSDPF
jgi:short-subunit dehydrogenase